jgi:cobalt-precorrin 5A hydrolase
MTAASIIAGIGYRKMTTANEIVALVDQALGQTGHQRADIAALAIGEFKDEVVAPESAAQTLGTKLHRVSAGELAANADRCETHSDLSQAHTSVPSVAEAAALAEAGPDSGLILPRIKSANATCALAVRALQPEAKRS